MNVALSISQENTIKVFAYADDLVVLSDVARLETASTRLETAVARIYKWAGARGLTMSADKMQVTSLKGDRKPGFTITLADKRVTAISPVKYLGVLLDSRWALGDNIVNFSEKSVDLYSRLRSMTSANWDSRQVASLRIYKMIFIPRMSYAVAFWSKATILAKHIKKLDSVQRRSLLAITTAYRTVSIDDLQAISGCMPLDLEFRVIARSQINKLGRNDNDDSLSLSEAFDIW